MSLPTLILPPLNNKRSTAFTLLELSISLVIIGLIAAGVLVGKDLIRSAGIRAQVSQLESYNQAVASFTEKYAALPGDMNNDFATRLGFAARGSYAGEGDGNGIIQCVTQDAAGNNWSNCLSGEAAMFWSDLTYANGMNLNLIPGSFSTAAPNTPMVISADNLYKYIPTAKIGGGNYIYVLNASANFFGISKVTSVDGNARIFSDVTMSVAQAFGIDSKIDDGLPTKGNVLAQYSNVVSNHGDNFWAGTTSYAATPPDAAASNSTCFDNGNSASNPFRYTMTVNAGLSKNCGLVIGF